jgi:AraC-like DNA-binding protein
MSNQQKEPIAEKCREFIDCNYFKISSVKEIASEVGGNYHTIRSHFKQVFGISLQEYLVSAKIKAAMDFLEKSDLTIKDIASKVGIKDPNYLERVFKNRYSLSMSIFRRICKLSSFIKSENYSLEKLRSEICSIEFNL